jgi:hypothetical protein
VDIPRIIDKPKFFHYTKPASIINILRSKSLFACPTYKFKDGDEYVHGLRLTKAHLERIRTGRTQLEAMPPRMQEVIKTFGMDARIILDETIAHIAYEIDHVETPRVEIFVTCTSTDGASERMAQEYGGFVLNFNWVLPLLGYAYPKPFSTAMLSRVTYNEAEFEKQIVPQGFIFACPHLRSELDELLASIDVASREAATAATAAVFLCIVAVNIKQPYYSHESEWRLKTVRLNHSAPTIFSLGKDGGYELRRQWGMSETAEFVDTAKGCRYLLDVRFGGRMIIEGIQEPREVLGAADATEIADAIREVRASYPSPDFMGPALDVRDLLLLAASLRR